MTRAHAELVARAARWLHKTKGHAVVLTEIGAAGYEHPDVIGWKAGFSTMIECKTSRADFLADRKKPFRQNPSAGLGRFRWYCAPPGLIEPADLPEAWGLVEPRGRTMVVAVKPRSWAFELDIGAQMREAGLLTSAVVRVAEGWGRGSLAYPVVPASGPPPPVCGPCSGARVSNVNDPRCYGCGRPLRGQVGAADVAAEAES